MNPRTLALLKATIAGENNLFEKIIKKKPELVHTRENNGSTPLMICIAEERINLVEILIKAKAAINAQNNKGQTALMYACKSKSTDLILLLLKAKADANLCDERGNTFLHTAASYNFVDVPLTKKPLFNLLNRSNKGGITPLMLSVRFSYTDFSRNLIAAGAHLNVRDPLGATAMSYAHTASQEKSIALLLDSIDSLNETVLSHAITSGDSNSLAYIFDTVQATKQYPAIITQSDKTGLTPLTRALVRIACLKGTSDEDIALKKTVTHIIQQSKNTSFHALKSALTYTNEPAARLLLATYKELGSAVDADGYSIYKLGILRKKTKSLTKKLAQDSLLDTTILTPKEQLALEKEEEEKGALIAQQEQQHQEDLERQRIAAELNHKKNVAKEIAHEAKRVVEKIDAYKKKGEEVRAHRDAQKKLIIQVRKQAQAAMRQLELDNALCRAIRDGDIEHIPFLLCDGARIPDTINIGTSPLRIAQGERGNMINIHPVEYLLSLPDLIADHAELTTLSIMSLVGAGLAIDRCDHEGETLLMQAAKTGNIKNTEILLRAGADVNAKNKSGHTACDLAKIYQAQSKTKEHHKNFKTLTAALSPVLEVDLETRLTRLRLVG